jgi:hypothetical protein
MYCTSCASEIPQFGKFCPSCGKKVDGEMVTANLVGSLFLILLVAFGYYAFAVVEDYRAPGALLAQYSSACNRHMPAGVSKDTASEYCACTVKRIRWPVMKANVRAVSLRNVYDELYPTLLDRVHCATLTGLMPPASR